MQRTGNKPMGLGMALAIGVLAVACFEEHLLDDVSFDVWCGEELCAWEVDSGEVRKVSTWHARDTAVELVGTPAQISQLSEASDVDCIRFELIANLDASARTSVQLDFNADGTLDLEQVIPTQKWKPSEFLIRTPKRYNGIRFIVRKAGPGRAIIGQVGAARAEDDECAGDRIVLGPQGPGAACAEDSDCSGRPCVDGVCSLCASDGKCEVGARCEQDAQCANGLGCTYGFCEECRVDSDCEGARVCAFPDPHELGPRVCVEPEVVAEGREGALCNGGAQCADGQACGATDGSVAPRCGIACNGPEDEGCGIGTRCRQRWVLGEALFAFDYAWLCTSDAECEETLTCFEEEE